MPNSFIGDQLAKEVSGHPVVVSLSPDDTPKLRIGYSDGSDCPLEFSSAAEWFVFCSKVAVLLDAAERVESAG